MATGNLAKSAFLLQKSTGKKIKLGGVFDSAKKPPKSKDYSASRYAEAELPKRVDLRPYLTEVEDQSQTNSCVANAIAGAYEYLGMRILGTAGDVSRLFIYYNARLIDGIEGDQGSSIATSIQVLQEMGTCPEDLWPYEITQVNSKPHDEAYTEATRFLIEEAEEIPLDLHAMRHCLAEGHPFVFSLTLFKSFDRASRRGRVPTPNPETEAGRTEHGRHAMLCVGYSDSRQVFIVRNSWGADWGDYGYCYIPYAYMTNPEHCRSCWTIRAVTDVDFTSGIGDEEDDEDFYYEEEEYVEGEEEEDDEYEYYYEEDDEESEEEDVDSSDEEEEEDDEDVEEDEEDEDDEEDEEDDEYSDDEEDDEDLEDDEEYEEDEEDEEDEDDEDDSEEDDE
jgi:C1A family cysteine protease